MTPYRERREAGEHGSPAATPTTGELDGFTKTELLAYAEAIGAEADASMTKAEIRAAVDAERGGV